MLKQIKKVLSNGESYEDLTDIFFDLSEKLDIDCVIFFTAVLLNSFTSYPRTILEHKLFFMDETGEKDYCYLYLYRENGFYHFVALVDNERNEV